jgi:hypothetical protein
MKKLAVIAGILFLALGIAGFAGLMAMPPTYSAVLAVAGVFFTMFGLRRRKAIVPSRAPGHDMRDAV